MMSSVVCLMVVCEITQSSLLHADIELEQQTVTDFEDSETTPAVWGVNIAGERASAAYSDDNPWHGAQCLKVSYEFVSDGKHQYFGLPLPVQLSDPIDGLCVHLHGDQSQCGFRIQLIDASGETHQRFPDSFGGRISFRGWKKVEFSIGDAAHESWGGDKNGRIDYPITSINFILSQPTDSGALVAVKGDVRFDLLSVASGRAEALPNVVSVVSPAYGADIQGDTRLQLRGAGFDQLTIRCWTPAGRLGRDAVVGTVDVDRQGSGSMTFPADQYPHGPITVRITGENDSVSDNCYLQLYNTGGIRWQQGAPARPPRAARGMRLVFADDFDRPLSISRDGKNATYASHKIGGGDFSGIPFGNHEDEQTTPFAQRETWLRIRADERRNTTGLIASIDKDGQGMTAVAPCYFECRFVAQSAPGTWPAFWVITNYMLKSDGAVPPLKIPQDELDVVEAYGGEGPGNPNQTGYWIATHWWNQGPDGGPDTSQPGFYGQVPMTTIAGANGATWWETPHVYGVRIGRDETIYYCDEIEVARHKTSRLSGREPLFFYANLAVGGSSGWKKDLSRYGGIADMYIDYVRVYSSAR